MKTRLFEIIFWKGNYSPLQKSQLILMPAKGKVSLTRQTIYVLIPILDLIAFYKIKHLRKYLLIVYVGVVGIASSVYSMIVTPESWEFNANYDPDYIFDPVSWALQIPMMAITYAISIYLVRKWSNEWNEQFES